LKAISEHDIIVDLGGDTFTDESGVLSTLKHSYDLILMRLLDKQYIVCSHTLGPYKHVLTKFIARFLLQRALAITVRDPQSYDYLVNKLKLKDVNLYLAPDLAFAAPEKHKRKYNDNHQPSTIGLNASPTICNYMLHSVDDYTKRLHFIIELYRDLVIHLLERHGYHILLIPTVLQPLKSPFSKKPVSDVIILKAIYEELNRRGYKDKVSIVLSEDFSAIDKALSKCDIFIATRMHAGISAIRHGIPTLFLASTVKYSGVISLLGITDFIVDVRGRNDISQLKEEIVSKVEKIITNYNHVRRTFEEFSKKATISARLHIEVIKKAKILSYFKEVPCYGCGTCVAACPTSALTLVINNHGCYRPWLDPLKCTTCKACLKVCPAISRR
jgi:polysaccharide pyruvyl transferase WcaK-like protein/NAD-dependent dihydropyrimidine dehydrogenase PreA subunit